MMQPQLPAGFEHEQQKAIKPGLFSELWLVKKVTQDKDKLYYAAKVEDGKSKHQLLKGEYELYPALGTYRGIAKVFQYVPQTPSNPYNTMIMERLGRDLDTVFTSSKKNFSHKTIIQLAVQMFTLVEYVHSQKIVHGAIQPDNFCFANPSQPMSLGYNEGYGPYLLHLIDYCLAAKYIDPTTGQHVKQCKAKVRSSPRFISINVHADRIPCRRDDLESLGYCWAYFFAGKKQLPWQEISKDKIKASMGAVSTEVPATSDPTEKENKQKRHAIERLIKEKKETTPVSLLFPIQEFHDYMVYVRSLDFDTTPDYEYIRTLLTAMYERCECDNTYDFQLN